MDRIIVLFLLSLPAAAPKGSHSLRLFPTYIKGQTPFPEYSGILMLDDVRVLYYNGDTKTFIRRGNTTNEDTVIDSEVFVEMPDDLKKEFRRKWSWIMSTDNLDKLDSIFVFQMLVLCELKDNGEPGQMIIQNAFQGSTTDEMQYIDNNFTYKGQINAPVQDLKLSLENEYYPLCIKTLKGYLETRRNQVNRKVKPIVRFLQKANTDSGGFKASCLATGFYPRHINLTLFRDEQPVADHEVTGGNLLPNDDGTYQMRKSLEISEEEQREKHTYTCTATHLSLDNKLDVTLEYDHGKLLTAVILSVLTVLGLLLIFGTVAAVIIWRKRHAASEEHADTTL